MENAVDANIAQHHEGKFCQLTSLFLAEMCDRCEVKSGGSEERRDGSQKCWQGRRREGEILAGQLDFITSLLFSAANRSRNPMRPVCHTPNKTCVDSLLVSHQTYIMVEQEEGVISSITKIRNYLGIKVGPEEC